MKKISNTQNTIRKRRHFSDFDELDDDIKLYILAAENNDVWDQLNAKFLVHKVNLINSLISLNPSSKEYDQKKNVLKRLEILFKETLLQLRFSSSFSGRGENPFKLEKDWEEDFRKDF